MFAEIGGLKVPLGAGGTHISVTKQSFESNDEYIIEDWDVESYYPSLAIVNFYFATNPSQTGHRLLLVLGIL
jgi:hypothetical protein